MFVVRIALRRVLGFALLFAASGASGEDGFVAYSLVPVTIGQAERIPFVIDRNSGEEFVADALVVHGRCNGFPGVCFRATGGAIAIPKCLGRETRRRWSADGISVEWKGGEFAFDLLGRRLNVVLLSVVDRDESETLLWVDREIGVVAISFSNMRAHGLGTYVLADEQGLGAGQACVAEDHQARSP